MRYTHLNFNLNYLHLILIRRLPDIYITLLSKPMIISKKLRANLETCINMQVVGSNMKTYSLRRRRIQNEKKIVKICLYKIPVEFLNNPTTLFILQRILISFGYESYWRPFIISYSEKCGICIFNRHNFKLNLWSLS